MKIIMCDALKVEIGKLCERIRGDARGASHFHSG
jgi:hypothetical protein